MQWVVEIDDREKIRDDGEDRYHKEQQEIVVYDILQ